ncbi:MAG: response regulator [Nitrospirae bacterium]|nr:response regulator [Nitrospirota bacterium]
MRKRRDIAKTKILIVEDEIITAMSLKQLFEHWGLGKCKQASSGREAFEKMISEKPDIVLIDIHLKGEINGIETARQLQANSRVPIIFITGYSDEETIKKADKIKPVAYFVKPLDFYKLRSTIESVVSKKKRNLKQKKSSNL